MRMSWIRNIASLAIIATMTSGCMMYRLETLRNTTPTGTPFQTELSKLYMDYATQKEKVYNWADSWYFADKGLQLAYGKDAAPEDLSDWNIPEDSRHELEMARAMLVETLTPARTQASPTRAAEAQFYFDCWVQKQEANWQADDIAFCRDNMMQAISDLNSGSMRAAPTAKSAAKQAAKKVKAAAKAEDKPVELAEMKEPEESENTDDVQIEKPAAEAKAGSKAAPKKAAKHAVEEAKDAHPETISYAVFFESGKAVISEPGKNVIGEVIGSLKNATNYEINLHVSANKEEGSSLASDRVAAVKKRLIEGGINEHSIKASNTASDGNSGSMPSRRIEIFLNE